MKLINILKNTLITLIIAGITIYLLLYLALPHYLNKNDYSKTITECVKKETGLILTVHKYKLSVSPLLEVNAKADEIQLFYPDKKQVLNIKKPDITLSTLFLLKKEIKFNKIKADEIQFATKLLKNGKTTFQQYLEENIPEKKQNTDFVLSKNLPDISVKKYIIKIKDEESGQKFKFSGDNFSIKQNLVLTNADVTTNGSFYCFDDKYLSYDLKITVPKILFKDVNKKLFDISVDNLYKYKFYADVKADLKVLEKKEKFDSLNGKLRIDNFSTFIGGKKLPPSFFDIVLEKENASLVSKFYTDYNESTDIKANFKITKPYKIDMKCNCPKADLKNLRQLSISVLEILKIKNSLSEFNVDGKVSADFEIKTDLKTLSSKGQLKISEANIKHKSIPLKITNINALVDFSDDSINIKKSNILVNNQPVKVSGTINKNAVADLLVSAQNLDLNHIMNAFPSLKPQKNLTINSGKLSLKTTIKGRLEKAQPQIFTQISDFSATENINKIKVAVKEIIINAKTNKEKYTGQLVIKGITCNFKGIPNRSETITSDNISAAFDEKDLTINPSKINLGGAKITLSGKLENYAKAPKSDITAQGTIDTQLLKSLVSNEYKQTIQSKGYLPIKANLNTSGTDSFVDVKILSNPQNYITPIHIANFDKITTLTAINAKIQDKNIIVQDLGIYYAPNINSLVNSTDLQKLKKAISLRGEITNNADIKNLHVIIPENLKTSIPDLVNAQASVAGDFTINGTIQNLVLNGNMLLSSISIPEYFIKAESANLNFNKNYITAKINNLKIKTMDVSIEALAPIDVLKTNQINHVKISSNYVDLDYLMELMPLLAQSKYMPGVDFPFTISSGKLFVKNCKIGDLKAENITADISSQKNILHLKNMFSDTYGGKTAGIITYNFPYSSINVQLQGRNLDAATAAKAFLPPDQQISGRLSFDANVTMFGNNLNQQMKTLKGHSDILINNARLGPLGRFEHFLYAQNLLSQKLIYANLNSAKQAVKPKDTGYVTYLKGTLKFSNGNAYLSPIYTAGPQMSMYITGTISLLNNLVDLEILGKVSSEVSSAMGMLGTMTIKEFLDEHTKYGQTISNLFNFCNSEIPELDISKIPELNPNYRYSTKNFRVLISGDPESVKAVKSFTWVNPPGTKQKALQEKLGQSQNGQSQNVTTPTQQTHQTESTLPKQHVVEPKEPITQPVRVESRPVQQSPKTTPSFLDNIPDSFK